MVLVAQDKIPPNSEPYRYFRRIAGACGKACVTVNDNGHPRVQVSPDACAACVNRCKQVPGNKDKHIVKVVQLPTASASAVSYSYGPNAFQLHGLPLPRPGHVLGLLGGNGIGKSTCLSVLSGKIKPNFGNAESNVAISEIVTHYRGSDLQNYFRALYQDELMVVTKPQLEASVARKMKGQTVRDMLALRNERGKMEYYIQELQLGHLLHKTTETLSGGELQRLIIACVLCRDAHVYLLDEVTSFLDVGQRLKVTRLIRELAEDSNKYVVVVEHDVTILEYLCDYVQCLYGTPGAYGVVSSRCRVRNGVNQFLAGYLQADNVRFRDEALSFRVAASDVQATVPDETQATTTKATPAAKPGTYAYPAMHYTYQKNPGDENEGGTSFTVHIEAGSFRGAECVLLLGRNGSGKSTFLDLLAGKIGNGFGLAAGGGGVSYKPQGLNPKLRQFPGTVQELLQKRIGPALLDRLFRLWVLKPLQVDDTMRDLKVAHLSGGELQRLSIALCLGKKKAQWYLVDEPSAGLDCEQRVVAAKVLKRWIVHHLGKTLVLVEHDLAMATALADRVVVLEGTPGVECTALAPTSLTSGLNCFLQSLGVTLRSDSRRNNRPRINKRNGRSDKEQKTRGEYFLLDHNDDDGEDNEEDGTEKD